MVKITTVNSLVSDHPWCSNKWSVKRWSLPGKITKISPTEYIDELIILVDCRLEKR